MQRIIYQSTTYLDVLLNRTFLNNLILIATGHLIGLKKLDYFV